MEMNYIADFPHNHIDRRPRKKPRFAWDFPQAHPKAQSGFYYGQDVGNGTSTGPSRLPTDHSGLYVKGVSQRGSPPWRVDDKDGHYMFALGENLTSRSYLNTCTAPGTFGQVLECWDRETREMVAIKVVRSIKKYREAAMSEIDVLQLLGKYDRNGSRCVQIRNWFDYRNHICIVFEMLGPSLYDFLRKNSYRPFPVDLVRELGRQLLECVAFMHDLRLIHTDLKPENILFVSPDYVKIPDYKHHNYIVSTRHYRAPEVILGLGWSYSCDIWSVGCILVELCTGGALFQTHDNLEHLAMMERVLGPLPQQMLKRADRHAEKYVRRGRLDWPDNATSRDSIKAVMKLPRLQNLVMQHVDHSAGEIIDLLQGLLRYDPSNRLTPDEALRHPFFSRDPYRRV
ncbi:Serine/threonine-protein kinase AFC2 [Linum perenne]